MKAEESYHYTVQLTGKDLWIFSMYHSYRGYLGIFNLLFTLASAYLLIVRWHEVTIPYKMLLIVCVLMFTVWQPLLLLLKAMKQASGEKMKTAIDMTFDQAGLRIAQRDQTVEIPWEQILKIVRIRGEYIFYMGRVNAYLLPARYVTDDEAWKDFLRNTAPEVCTRRLK